jgi:hypothetical protein
MKRQAVWLTVDGAALIGDYEKKGKEIGHAGHYHSNQHDEYGEEGGTRECVDRKGK